MKSVHISEATILSLPTVNRLFKHAVEAHFTYFPPEVRRRVVGEHTVPRLLLATLDQRRVVLVAKAGSRIIGYAIGAAPATGPAQLFWLYVDPAHRGTNIGLSLLSRMLKLLADKGAKQVSIATHDHRRYYERQGFKFSHATKVDGVAMDILTFRCKS